jgi:MerC mercury resistance protein
VIFSFVGDLQQNSWWEYLDYIFLILGALAVYLATQKQKIARKILFYIAYSIFALGIFLEDNLSLLSYVGSFGLILLHIKNYLEHKNCPQ